MFLNHSIFKSFLENEVEKSKSHLIQVFELVHNIILTATRKILHFSQWNIFKHFFMVPRVLDIITLVGLMGEFHRSGGGFLFSLSSNRTNKIVIYAMLTFYTTKGFFFPFTQKVWFGGVCQKLHMNL